jgi:hypothetical protein
MTDKELEILFKSIDNFDAFSSSVKRRQNIRFKNGLELMFNSPDNIEIYLPDRHVTIDSLTFERILNEISVEKLSQENLEISNQERLTKERLRNEIFELEGTSFKVHREYIDDMFFASDIASAHGTYLNKLRELIKIFHRDNRLFIDEKEIKNKIELIDFLKSYGFTHIDKDLTLK